MVRSRTMPAGVSSSTAETPVRRWGFAVAGAAVFAALVGFTSAHHEMWRDELDAWLVARDSATPLAVFREIRYGGHPSLWYLLLWPLAHLTHSLASMQVLNVVIASVTALLVLRFAPASRWFRGLAVSGYFVVYEYGTIARNYGLSVLALVGACCVFPHRRAHPLLLGVLLGLAAHTSVHGMILAVALAAALALDLAASERAAPGRRAASEWRGVAVATALFALAAWQMHPPPDSGYAMGWSFAFDPKKARDTLATVAAAWVPIPQPGRFFWGTQLLADVPGYVGAAWLLSLALLAGAAVALARSRIALAYLILGVGGLLVFFYAKFFGYLRHHGFLWIGLATSAWIAAAELARAETRERPAPRASRVRFGLLVVLLAAQAVAAAIAVAGDLRYRFSAAEATAALMKRRGVDRLVMVGARDVTAMAVLAHLDKQRAYYPEGRRFGSHIVFDAARLEPWSVWADSAMLARALGERVSIVVDRYVMGLGPPPAELLPRLSEVGCEASEIMEDESYCVLVLSP